MLQALPRVGKRTKINAFNGPVKTCGLMDVCVNKKNHWEKIADT